MSRIVRRLGRTLGACCAALLLVAIACRDRSVTGPGLPRHSTIALAPRFQAGVESALPVSRIRVEVIEVDDQGVPLDQGPLVSQTESVDPAATSWPVTLDLVISAPVRVIVTAELLHDEPTSEGPSTSVEWAARAGPLVVTPGRTQRIESVQLGRGPLPNLDVTDVFIGEFPSNLFVGDGFVFGATLEPADLPGTQAFFGTLDPTIVGVDVQGQLTALAPGTARITVAAGLHADTISLTVLDPVAAVSFLGVEAGGDQQATVGTAVAVPPSVRAFSANESPVRGVPITFTVTSGGGTIAGPTTVTTGADGVATLGGWTLGTTAGTNVITATVQGTNVSTTISATGTPAAAVLVAVAGGNNQNGAAGTALAQPLVAVVRDQFGNAVPGVRVDWATTGGGTLAPAVDTSDALGQVQATWTPGFTTTTQTATATAAGVATAAVFTATVTLPPPQVQLALADADKVSLNHVQLVNVTLPTAAPAGGAQVTVTSSAPSVLAVLNGGNVSFAAGQTQGTVQVQGLVEGSATLTATSPQYQNGTLAVQVELRVLGVPTTINVPYGQTASLPINIPRAAPAGGITVTITTSDPSRVGLAATTAVIPAGAVTGFVTLNGVLPGPSTLVVSHPLYDPDTTAATTTAALDIVNSSYTLNTSFGTTALVRFTSSNVAIPAPAPGIPVAVSAADPACLTVPASATITTGLTDIAIPLTAGPGQVFPCTTRLRVTSSTAGVAADSVNVTVNAQPAITVTSTSVGAGLQRIFSASFAASNHGGTTVRITSPDPQQLLVAPDANTPGSAFLDLPLGIGATQVNFYVQALDAARGAFGVTASAPGFSTGTGTATIVQPAIDVSGVNTNTTSLSGDDPFTVRTGIANGQGQFLVELQDRRAGGSPLVATATVSDTNVIKLVTSAGAGVTGTAQVAALQSNTPTSVAAGGFAVRPIGNGTATVSATIPGFISTSSNSIATVTVTTPAITASAVSVGSGLQRITGFSLGAPAPAGGATVRITSTDPTTLLVSPNATTAGTDFIDVTIAAGNSSANFYVQGVEGRTGTPAVTLAATGYAAGRQTMTVLPAALDVSGVNTSTTTLTADDPFTARVGIANGQLQFLTELQDVRAGGQAITVTFVSDTPSVGALVTQAGEVGGTATAVIAVGQSNTPTSVASGGVALRPKAAGVTRVSASAPGVVTTSNNGAFNVTVSQPTQSLSQVTVGSGLQRFTGGSLGAPAPAGTVVRLTSADPSRLRLSPNATTAGTATLDIPLTTGSQSYNFYVQGMEGQTGTVAVTATTPLYADGTANITVAQSYLDMSGVNTSTTTLSNNDDFAARIGIANAAGQFLTELQDVRAGGTPVVVAFATSVPGVAQLVPSTTNGATATATIAVGQSNTPSSVGNGGVQLDPLTAGTTVVSMTATQGQLAIPATSNSGSALVTVSAPALTVQSVTVGAGLQRISSVSLGAPAPAGGSVVRLTSSQPAVLLLSPNASTAGAPFIDVTVPAGQSSFSFYTQGVEGQVGTPTVSATAPGFADGSATEPVVKPALDISGLNTSVLETAADDPFTVRVGIPNGTNQFLTELQDVRAGGQALAVTVTSSNATAGQLATSATRAASVTVSIPVGQSNTASTVSAGGVAFDPLAAGSTSVTATIPNFTTTINNGTVTVTVTAQAGLVQAAVRAAMTAR